MIGVASSSENLVFWTKIIKSLFEVMYVVSRPVSLTRTRDELKRLQRKTIDKLYFVASFSPKRKKSFCKILNFIEKSRLFRHEIIISIPGRLHWTQLRLWSNESSVLSPTGQSAGGKLSAHTFLTDTILAPGSQPDSSQLLWDIRAVNIGSHARNRATRTQSGALVTVSTAQRNV